MRIHNTIAAAFMGLGLVATTGCDRSAPELTAPEVQAPTTASFQRQNVGQSGVTAGNLLAALNNVNVNIQDFLDLQNLTVQDIQVVDVDNVLNNANILNNSPFLNNITILQNFLNNSLNNNNVEILNNALNNLDVDVVLTDVVAIDVLSGGDLLVFTR